MIFMSKEILQDVDNIVDHIKSEYYFVNKTRRLFWHSKSVTISTRDREKNDFNKAPDISLNIRAFLLNNEKYFLKQIGVVSKKIRAQDEEHLRLYVYGRYPDHSREVLDSKMGLIIRGLSQEEIREAMNLDEVISCRLLGYEKELFYLKCYSWRLLPVFVMRILYNTKCSHLKLFHLYEKEQLMRGLDFEEYLERIKFS